MKHWTQTYTGIAFDLEDPQPDMVNEVDIAHALSMQCRFNGHCQKFFSVAQHSVMVSARATSENSLWALLHDAAEAYIGDMVSPIKHMTENEGFRALETRVMRAVCERFGLPIEQPEEIKRLDMEQLAYEFVHLMPNPPMPWNLPVDLEQFRGTTLRAESQPHAKKSFLTVLKYIRKGMR
jgi:hypothetical protein